MRVQTLHRPLIFPLFIVKIVCFGLHKIVISLYCFVQTKTVFVQSETRLFYLNTYQIFFKNIAGELSFISLAIKVRQTMIHYQKEIEELEAQKEQQKKNL